MGQLLSSTIRVEERGPLEKRVFLHRKRGGDVKSEPKTKSGKGKRRRGAFLPIERGAHWTTVAARKEGERRGFRSLGSEDSTVAGAGVWERKCATIATRYLRQRKTSREKGLGHKTMFCGHIMRQQGEDRFPCRGRSRWSGRSKLDGRSVRKSYSAGDDQACSENVREPPCRKTLHSKQEIRLRKFRSICGR